VGWCGGWCGRGGGGGGGFNLRGEAKMKYCRP